MGSPLLLVSCLAEATLPTATTGGHLHPSLQLTDRTVWPVSAPQCLCTVDFWRDTAASHKQSHFTTECPFAWKFLAQIQQRRKASNYLISRSLAILRAWGHPFHWLCLCLHIGNTNVISLCFSVFFLYFSHKPDMQQLSLQSSFQPFIFVIMPENKTPPHVTFLFARQLLKVTRANIKEDNLSSRNPATVSEGDYGAWYQVGPKWNEGVGE